MAQVHHKAITHIHMYIHIEMEALMLHVKFQDPRSLGSGDEDCQRFSPYKSMTAILVM